jgi:site-specific DNA-methyltransferase (adenine-specific)
MTPYFAQDGVTLYHGDCREILQGLPDESVSAIVTDPPYGLAFMGKKWDYDVPAVEVWAECLRVLKPGGHLLAFAGTRTQHRMATAIEDAGFEIRDMIAWCYGSGFPKSLDVSKAIDKAAGAEREVVGNHGRSFRPHADGGNDGWLRPSHEVHGNITAPATEAAKQWQGWGTALKPSWESVTWARKPLPLEAERRTIVMNLSQMEARLWLLQNASAVKLNSQSNQSEFAEVLNTAQWTAGDCINTQAVLCDQMGTSQYVSAVTSSLSIVSSWKNTLEESWSDGNTSITETESRQIIDWKTLRCSLSQITAESIVRACSLTGGFSANAGTAERYFSDSVVLLQSIRRLSAIEPAMLQAQALLQDEAVRPSLEPVMVARKPLCGTVAENVLQHGTGALNVDGCRVGTEERPRLEAGFVRNGRTDEEVFATGYGRPKEVNGSVSGRWPANLIHDGSDEVVGLFPETAPAKQADRGKGIDGATFRHASGAESGIRGHDDAGGSAARFFYCAKADKADRGPGNNHPTVKPVDLMRYLVRLVCPIGGVVLDPFSGSGTTLAAAQAEGCLAIGVEREAAYCEIIKGRFYQRRLF